VRSISWLEDDVGFVSSDSDFTIKVWMLPRISAGGAKHNAPVWEKRINNVEFTSTIAIKQIRDTKEQANQKDGNKVRI
jgi:hypothetical protein